MSLTTFIKGEQIRDKIDELYDKPDFDLTNEMVAPPIGENPRLVGTAFDYLMRFWLEREAPTAKYNQWVAETAVYQTLAAVPEMIKNYGGSRDYDKAERTLSLAKEAYEDFLDTGNVTNKLLQATMDLAKLDGIYRANYYPENLDTYKEENTEDLQNLYEAIPEGEFVTENKVLLNPTFGNASRLVGGADADLIIDDTLIDIKTVKSSRLKRHDWRQLIGYLVLANLDPDSPRLNGVGLYYSRFGEPWTTSADIIYENDEYSEFRDWFRSNTPN